MASQRCRLIAGLLLLLIIVMVILYLTIVDPVKPDGPVCPPTPPGTLSRAHFPEGFLFGTATAAYQEDIQLMKNLNTDSFRLSIAWTRIFPHGTKDKGVSESGVQFYHDLIDELKLNGIIPFVTVFHWDTPQVLEDEYGGFLSDRIVMDFRAYADFVFHEYGGKVKHWITFNEPWVYSHAGYDIGKKAPGRCSDYINKACPDGHSGRECYIVTHNLLNAHAEAVEAFRACKNCTGGKIGIAHSPLWFEPHDFKDAQDGASIERALDFMLGWHLETTITGEYPKIMRDIVGDRLPRFNATQRAKLINSTDFVGLNYYYSQFSAHLEKIDYSKPYWKQDSLIHWEGYGEILGDKDSVEVGTKDTNRKYYLQRHLLSMHEAICTHKVNVTGYFTWSLLDNFEWQDGYKTRFGLYYIDFKNNLTRHEKLSAKYYKDFLSKGIRPSQIKKDEL
ncbi:unnamed protein product [Microthlaspi erraticum]|uniref:Thioglucosidase n=1 Tax=Microthlaspi erraticum TaxID=1685480 RepID=A0A6D2JWU1_9BRAS|nr:unnamed protein product [Microthlaspi erraticum]